MPLNLTNPLQITTQLNSFLITSYAVNRVKRKMAVFGEWINEDRKQFVIQITNYDAEGNLTNEFDNFYATFNSDIALYNFVAQKLSVEGEIDLTGEPQ